MAEIANSAVWSADGPLLPAAPVLPPVAGVPPVPVVPPVAAIPPVPVVPPVAGAPAAPVVPPVAGVPPVPVVPPVAAIPPVPVVPPVAGVPPVPVVPPVAGAPAAPVLPPVPITEMTLTATLTDVVSAVGEWLSLTVIFKVLDPTVLLEKVVVSEVALANAPSGVAVQA